MKNSMSTQELRAWTTVMIGVLKSEGILWKNLSGEEQLDYVIKWAKEVHKIRPKMVKDLNKEVAE